MPREWASFRPRSLPIITVRLWTEARDLFARVGAKPKQKWVQRLLDALPQE